MTLKSKCARPIPEDQLIKSATLSLTSTGKYFISILVEYEKNIETIAPKKEKILGLDYSSQDDVH
jgi:putative transposase